MQPVLSLETEDHHIDGKQGAWHTIDYLIVDEVSFFLMEHNKWGQDIHWLVLSERGDIVTETDYGFDNTTIDKIKEYLSNRGNMIFQTESVLDTNTDCTNRESVLERLKRKQMTVKVNEIAKTMIE